MFGLVEKSVHCTKGMTYESTDNASQDPNEREQQGLLKKVN